MKTMHNVFWELDSIAREYGMYDNLTQAEIDELAALSEDRTFRTLLKRYEALRPISRASKRPFYQVMRPTVVLMTTYLQRWLTNCRSLRVRAIVSGCLHSMLNKMEYHVNYYKSRFVDLIKAHPNMSDAELAKFCVAHKIDIVLDDAPEQNSDINWLITMLQEVRANMNSPHAAATAPITTRESIFAARWIEIFERQK